MIKQFPPVITCMQIYVISNIKAMFYPKLIASIKSGVIEIIKNNAVTHRLAGCKSTNHPLKNSGFGQKTTY